MRRRLAGLAAAFLLAVPLPAHAQGGGIGFVERLCGGGEHGPLALFALAVAGETGGCIDLTDRLVREGKTWTIDVTDIGLGDLGSLNRLTATFNSDPFITFGASTTNLVAGPVTYAFLFGTPIVPGLYSSAASTAGVSVTNAPGTTASVDPSAIYPTYVSGYGTVGGAPTNLGVDLGTTTCSASGAIVSTTTCNYGTTTNTFAPTFYDNLEALLTYDQAGLAGVASWSGAVQLEAATTTPEPVSLTLVATGLVGVLAVRHRRRRAGAST